MSRASQTGRWVLGHGVEEALVLAPVIAAAVLPMWQLQLAAGLVAALAVGLWVRHEVRTRRALRQTHRRVTTSGEPTHPNRAAVAAAPVDTQQEAHHG